MGNLILDNTVKPVYNDHRMGYFSAFWSAEIAEIVNTSKLVLSIIITTHYNKSQVMNFVIELVVTERCHCS